MMYLKCGLCPSEVWCILLMLETCGFSSAQFKTAKHQLLSTIVSAAAAG